MLLSAQTDRAVQTRLERELADVECRFGAELISDLPCVNSLVGHIERYRGKMLRPMLVLVTGMATSPSGRDVTDAHRVVATVMEMVHMATLVHDDVLDEADVRRRGETVNALSGNETAVMLGDYLISHAYHLCSSLDGREAVRHRDEIDPTSAAASLPAISRIVADATNTVCEGELLQLANRNNWSLDEASYFEMIRRKTASLCGVSCRIAALLHGASEDDTDRVEDYGEKVGVAFQIVDDVLDIVGVEETVGKTLGRDLIKGKLTLPVIHFLQHADEAQRAKVLKWLERGLERDNCVDPAEAIRNMIVEAGSVDYARQWARKLIEQAQAALAGLPDSAARSLLHDMADAVLARRA